MIASAAISKIPISVPERTDYLPFVDGLRAISILAVVGFHSGIAGLPGGFVGVDVFFVISGFLIINHINDELQRGQFSLLRFYARRVLRIQPALLLVLLLVSCAVPFVVPNPDVYFNSALAALLSPLMGANILFYLSQGYFDPAADMRPLLHIWTLSVEEQFYLVTPLLLAFILAAAGRNRFFAAAGAVGIALFGLSLVGAIAYTVASGRNPAFYLPHWRAWEFIAGGFIAPPLIAATRRAPPFAVDAIGWLGLACIAAAIATLDAKMLYPSWRALIPVWGAALVLLSGLAEPRGGAARLLATPWLVGIGLVSYGWYLWHWPLISFVRTLRLGDHSVAWDFFGGGVVAFILAVLTYRYVELPIRRWRARGGLRNSGRVVLAGIAACLAVGAIGGAIQLGGYFWNKSFVAARYGTEGKGTLENGCRSLGSAVLPPHCLKGRTAILLGDSHATVLFGAFARRLHDEGLTLVSVARGGCNPVLFAPSLADQARTSPCASLMRALQQMLHAASPETVIVSSAWANPDAVSLESLGELVREFAPSTRILFIGPVPFFPYSSLDCVVLSDRFGVSRDRCTVPRAEVEAKREWITRLLKATAERFANLRYVDPLDLFCDSVSCRPYADNQLFFRDQNHVVPNGADRIYDGFPQEFRWVTSGQ